jgi:hypothetical protein
VGSKVSSDRHRGLTPTAIHGSSLRDARGSGTGWGRRSMIGCHAEMRPGPGPLIRCSLDAFPLTARLLRMRELTAMLHPGEPDEGGFWATCREVPGANGQGETRVECLKSLAEAGPRHQKIKRPLARSICRNLSVEVPKGA